MTRQCREVLAECDFPESDAREVELLLTKYSPRQLVRFVWKKDPKGEHALDWFRPFFNGYLKELGPGMPGPADDAFWAACDRMETSSALDLPIIWEMSRDPKAFMAALVRSRVKVPRYVYQVFLGTRPVKAEPVGRTVVELKIGNGGVEVKDL
jgi:hypothetical protein